ncbi:MAG: ABC transporter permease [Anaerolineae bacterium]|nr:ABC transporter permease [Anaerolineae bacterium]NIN98711.1 ABC transporter permease [Anaerolineae bacterium]NIQ81601.1 ABC transporter permease [Anaerolineae bacterium]
MEEVVVFVTIILSAGIAAGTPILYGALGEIFAERSGILNLGVEGMMLTGALAGIVASLATGSVWIGALSGMVAGGVLSLIHAFISITLRGDQVVSGLALTIFGAGLTAFLGFPYVNVPAPKFAPVSIPLLEHIPLLGPVLFQHDLTVYVCFVLVPVAWFWINKTRQGLHLRAVGENPAAADALGVSVVRTRYVYTVVGGVLGGLGGASLSLAYTPGWIENMTAGWGWIAVGLVIFAAWDPWRAAFGAYLFGAISRVVFDVQMLPTAGLPQLAKVLLSPEFLRMMPYAAVILILVSASREVVRRRIGAPAALGTAYTREEAEG